MRVVSGRRCWIPDYMPRDTSLTTECVIDASSRRRRVLVSVLRRCKTRVRRHGRQRHYIAWSGEEDDRVLPHLQNTCEAPRRGPCLLGGASGAVHSKHSRMSRTPWHVPVYLLDLHALQPLQGRAPKAALWLGAQPAVRRLAGLTRRARGRASPDEGRRRSRTRRPRARRARLSSGPDRVGRPAAVTQVRSGPRKGVTRAVFGFFPRPPPCQRGPCPYLIPTTLKKKKKI